MSDQELPKATRFLSFEELLTGECVIDAVREVTGPHLAEELVFVDDEICYMVGQRDNAPSGNVFVSLAFEGWVDGRMEQTMIPVIKPEQEASVIVVMHGYIGAARRTPQKQPDDLQCYLAVRDFAEKLRLALVRRIADPGILLKRPPVVSDARNLKPKP